MIIPEQFIAPKLLIQFFPELTIKQVYVLTLFCLGVSVNDISFDLKIKPESLTRQLFRIVSRLECSDLKELKNLFMRRVFFAVLFKLQ